MRNMKVITAFFLMIISIPLLTIDFSQNKTYLDTGFMINTERELAHLKINNQLKNELIIMPNGQKRIFENVGQEIFDYTSTNTSPSNVDLHLYFVGDNSKIKETDILIDGVIYYFDSADTSINRWRKWSTDRIALKAPKGSTPQNPLTVTYELAVKNPKSKVIEDSDYYGLQQGTNIDYLIFKKPTDSKSYNNVLFNNNIVMVEGYTMFTLGNADDVSNIGKIATNLSSLYFHIIVEKGTMKDSIIGKTLTYELAQPRLAETKLVEHSDYEFIGIKVFNGYKDSFSLITGLADYLPNTPKQAYNNLRAWLTDGLHWLDDNFFSRIRLDN